MPVEAINRTPLVLTLLYATSFLLKSALQSSEKITFPETILSPNVPLFTMSKRTQALAFLVRALFSSSYGPSLIATYQIIGAKTSIQYY